ncbi:MAD2L1-binding protein [Frankliniella occidentalis]|uniref:MAD2L1-binding protein n=1 Tax=Frankliniella occidentalis TaxID=133901 RepID=A0A6J1S345_FRAOC|nr:MAD2L1-binding protein [Frankliniella occidentalis]
MPAPVLIDVNLKDVLTASMCSHLAIEFFKHIAYQRQQLPFPYKQLQSVIRRKDTLETNADDQPVDNTSGRTIHRSCQVVQAETEFKKVKAIMESMQTAFQCLEEEICNANGMVEEVAMILGATPLSPRDVYRFQYPPLLHGHLDSKHPHQSSLLELFRCLISSEQLHTFFNQPLSPTNMYLFLRKNNTDLVSCGFSPKERYNIPMSGKHAIIRLMPPTSLPKCICGGTNIFSDKPKDQNDSHVEHVIESKPDEPQGLLWFQAHHTLKGFKDVKINGTSVSTVWLQSR